MSSLTDERLRYWLNTNQSGRERMCAGLLGIAGDYSHIRPRRPEGGPDGGRDLDAIYRSSVPVAVGIGFRNNVSDDQTDRRWVLSKITADAENARVRTGAERFVFFTNVDMTPAEIESALRKVLETGWHSCEIFYRERMRLLLDSPEGLGFRTAYLQIPLDAAEQAAFFSKLMSGVGAQGTSPIIERLDRMEFRADITKPIDSFYLVVRVSDQKWWRRLVGGAVGLYVQPWDDSPKPIRTTSLVAVARREKRPAIAGALGRKRVHLTARIRRTVAKAESDVIAEIAITSFDNTKLLFHFNAGDLFGEISSGPASHWLDRTAWSISVPKAFADVIVDVRLLVDSWYISPDGHLLAGESRTGVKLDLSGLSTHRRERTATAVRLPYMIIDSRRVTPMRRWDVS